MHFVWNICTSRKNNTMSNLFLLAYNAGFITSWNRAKQSPYQPSWFRIILLSKEPLPSHFFFFQFYLQNWSYLYISGQDLQNQSHMEQFAKEILHFRIQLHTISIDSIIIPSWILKPISCRPKPSNTSIFLYPPTRS